MDLATTVYLNNIGALCNIRISLCDMDALCKMGELCNMGVLCDVRVLYNSALM